jgi:general secretion pathway protein D
LAKFKLHASIDRNVTFVVRFLQTFALLSAAAVVCPLMCRGEDFAASLYKAGQKAEKAGDKFHAFLLYAQAAALAPTNAEFAMRKSAMQADAGMSASTRLDRVALGVASRLAETDAEPLTVDEMVEARVARMPPRLKGPEGLKSFDLTGDPKSIVEKVMAAYGLMVVFEADYQIPSTFRFHLEDVRFEDALRTLETQSNSFLVPVNERLALMVRDTAQKRTEMSPAMAIAIPIPERISVQDAQEMMTAVVSTLEIRKFQLDPVKRVVYLRDQVSKIAAARTMLTNLSRLRAQVEVDVEFLEVTKSSSLGYGLQLPTSSSLINFSSFLGNAPGAGASGLTRFLTFGGGATFFGIGIASSAVMATFTKSDSDVILKSQIVTLDGQAAELHVGEKYPIVTASYSGGSTSTVGTGQASGLIAPPTINFVDLGLVLKITPSVHEGGEMTLDVSSEFKVLGASDANGNPAISNRKYNGKVRLKMDESAVVAGLVSTVDGDTRTGIFGLASIPWIGRLLRSNTINHSSSEVLLVLRPHLVDLGPWEEVTKSIWVGTETKPLTLF